MRKYSILVVAGVVLSLMIAMSSCKKSHETPVKPKLSFSEATKTVKESDETVDITMTLDQPAPDFTLHSTPDQTVSLSEFQGQAVIQTFYPADWSPVCGDHGRRGGRPSRSRVWPLA